MLCADLFVELGHDHSSVAMLRLSEAMEEAMRRVRLQLQSHSETAGPRAPTRRTAVSCKNVGEEYTMVW